MRNDREIKRIEYLPVASLSALIEARTPTIFPVYEPASLPPNEPLLLGDQANQNIRQQHLKSHNASPVGFALLPDVVLSGPSIVGSDEHLHLLGSLVPFYVDRYIENGWLRSEALSLNRRTERYLPDLSVLVTHFNSAVYGHWLLEGMPKLLLLRRMRSTLPPFRLVGPRSLPAFVAQWTNLLLPGVDFESYDDGVESVRCKRLLIPTMLCSADYSFHPIMNDLIDELLRLVGASASVQDKKIYITKSVPSHYRKMVNQDEIEAIAHNNGLTVLCPERLSIAEQIGVFASAAFVAGEFGSAMHNTLFGRHTTVLCLNWINNLQSRIAQLRRQRVAYLLPSDGQPVLFERGAGLKSYHIDPDTFSRAIAKLSALDIGSSNSLPRPLDSAS